MKPGAWLTSLGAEILKQHRSRTAGKAVFFSLLLWPALGFVTAYFSMRPYRTGEGSVLSRVIPDGNIPLFLLSGYLVFQLFWTVVQSAWLFERERREGTLELVFMTPSSKTAFLFGRSLYSLLHGIWMFAVFAVLTFLFVAVVSRVHWLALTGALLLIVASAAIWGALLSALALFSRDAGFLYYIFQAPMELFGGVRVPPQVFPGWAAGLSLLFPVTYSLILVRGALYGSLGTGWRTACLTLLVFDLAVLGLSFLLLRYAERYARRKGSWTMF